MDLYYVPASATCRSVLMTAKALGLELNKKLLNPLEGEQLKPEFIKINPQHTIPTLVDNGFSIWESRAIIAYLVEKYGKSDSLYPKDPQKRAVVNQRLYFDMDVLYKPFGLYISHFRTQQPADPEQLKKFEEALGYLNTFLEGHKYVAGDTLTIADIAILSTISTMDVVKVDLSKYSNIVNWYENAKKVTPGWEENWEGCLALSELIKSFSTQQS